MQANFELNLISTYIHLQIPNGHLPKGFKGYPNEEFTCLGRGRLVAMFNGSSDGVLNIDV